MENTLNIRNPEHYMDTTPHDAINGMKPASGDVWTYGQWDDECLILKNQGNFCNALKLIPVEKEGYIPVGDMWVNPAMVMFVFMDGIHDFKRKLPEMVFTDVLDDVEAALDISINVTVSQGDKPVSCETDLLEAQVKAECAEKHAEALQRELVNLLGRYDMLKGMYYELIDKMLEVRA
jgi:hypothetical protein